MDRIRNWNIRKGCRDRYVLEQVDHSTVKWFGYTKEVNKGQTKKIYTKPKWMGAERVVDQGAEALKKRKRVYQRV